LAERVASARSGVFFEPALLVLALLALVSQGLALLGFALVVAGSTTVAPELLPTTLNWEVGKV
jgi:hypothetical protein